VCVCVCVVCVCVSVGCVCVCCVCVCVVCVSVVCVVLCSNSGTSVMSLAGRHTKLNASFEDVSSTLYILKADTSRK